MPTPPKRFRVAPAVERGRAGYWSRWEKTPTTMGPLGRTVTTVVLMSWVLWALGAFIIYFFVISTVAGIVLRDVWKKGWVATPDAPPNADAPSPRIESEPRPEPVPREIPLSTRIAWGAIVAVVAGSVIVYANTTGDTQRYVEMSWMISASVLLFRWMFKG